VSGSNLTFVEIEKTNSYSEFTNYFKSLSLPIKPTSVNLFTGTTTENGGWADTSFSGLGSSKVLMAVVNNSQYGELIDGKSIKMSLPIATGYTTGGVVTGITTYDIYSTYQNKGGSLSIEDANVRDTSVTTSFLGNNVALLFSDSINKPNGDSMLSWATGYNTNKPFANNGKQLYNLTTNSNIGNRWCRWTCNCNSSCSS
jgi:hypothetical protein